MVEALESVGMWPIKDYIWRRQDNIADYIYKSPHYELCIGRGGITVSIRFISWWGKDLTWEEKGNGAREGEEREVG